VGIDSRLLDELLADYGKPEDVIGENGLLKQLTKAVLERVLNAELTEHVGSEKHDPAGYNSGNSSNGTTKKKLKGDFGEMELETPRDRNGSFEPRIVSKGQTGWASARSDLCANGGRQASISEEPGCGLLRGVAPPAQRLGVEPATTANHQGR
jgi:hypothetical protein